MRDLFKPSNGESQIQNEIGLVVLLTLFPKVVPTLIPGTVSSLSCHLNDRSPKASSKDRRNHHAIWPRDCGAPIQRELLGNLRQLASVPLQGGAPPFIECSTRCAKRQQLIIGLFGFDVRTSD